MMEAIFLLRRLMKDIEKPLKIYMWFLLTKKITSRVLHDPKIPIKLKGEVL